MGALQIYCMCSETQMNNLVKTVYLHILNGDLDEPIEEQIDNVRIVVRFDFWQGEISVKEAVVLDADTWSELEEDSVVFRQRLRDMLSSYNKSEKELRCQAEDIHQDQLYQMMS